MLAISMFLMFILGVFTGAIIRYNITNQRLIKIINKMLPPMLEAARLRLKREAVLRLENKYEVIDMYVGLVIYPEALK